MVSNPKGGEKCLHRCRRICLHIAIWVVSMDLFLLDTLKFYVDPLGVGF